ncbi:MAG: DNA polymerase I [Planctomycetes bacterium]|nr:DNA polymerase I [Planctomycetota bacterium]
MLTPFKEIWLTDFEFTQPAGERPTPVCMVAREYRTGRLVRLWQDQLRSLSEPPFSVGPGTLFVAFYASAEMGCFKALGWPMPVRVLDLYAEFRCLTSGLPTPCGCGLLGALNYFGLDALDTVEKDSMRALAMRGGDYTADEQQALLDYCQTDVDALAKLLPAMMPTLDLDRALVRGRYMRAVAEMEWHGIPIDTDRLAKLRTNWASIQDRLIQEIDRDYGVYQGRTFKHDEWAAWLAARGIPWPRLPSGALALDDDTFKEMARSYPEVSPIRELRASLSQLHLNELAVGTDGRNRCLLSAFRSRTGRNQPSNSHCVFGPATWLRGLVKPTTGWAVAYCDWSQQEFGIGAALSGDKAMQHAYLSGDPYLTFAMQARAVPPDATKATHSAERERFKVCALAVQYGMAAEGLAKKLDDCPARGRELLRLHRDTYPTYWKWSDAIRDYAVLSGKLRAVFGWTVNVGQDANPRSLRNFPLQANGSEMLRIACCLATERGIRVCAPVHDALLVEGPLDEIEDVVAKTQRAMQEASEVVLSGFSLRSDATIVRHPDRYSDKRGAKMWDTVQRLIGGGDER